MPRKRRAEPKPPATPLTRRQARDELISAGMSGEQADQMLADSRRRSSSEFLKYHRRVALVSADDDTYLVTVI